jgi:hypothetical protein
VHTAAQERWKPSIAGPCRCEQLFTTTLVPPHVLVLAGGHDGVLIDVREATAMRGPAEEFGSGIGQDRDIRLVDQSWPHDRRRLAASASVRARVAIYRPYKTRHDCDDAKRTRDTAPVDGSALACGRTLCWHSVCDHAGSRPFRARWAGLGWCCEWATFLSTDLCAYDSGANRGSALPSESSPGRGGLAVRGSVD